MKNILTELSGRKSVKSAIKANWEAYHYCLAQSPSVELSIGRYLTWLITNLPDHFMNLVVCNQLPSEGVDDLIENALIHFQSMNIRKLSWLTTAIFSRRKLRGRERIGRPSMRILPASYS